MARRRRRRFGEVKLKKRGGKISRLVYHHNLPSRRVGIKVFVSRYAADTAGYQAWACPASSGNRAIRASGESNAYQRIGGRCGPYGYGRTPTRAIEKALIALGKSGALRKGGR
jgi:hypothetical protein